jgi:TrmH family RNA methyltransferase
MINSTANERVKAVRKLFERKARQESGLFLVEGLRIVAEAVETGAQLEQLVVAPDLLKSAFGKKLIEEQISRGVPVTEVSGEVFQRISLKEGPQGIAAVVHQRWMGLNEVQLKPGEPEDYGTWVALDSVADPGNLGTILRTHDAVGGQGVMLLDQSTDPYDPSAVRASMGAVFTQSLVRTTFTDFADWKRRNGIFIVGTSDKAVRDYHEAIYPPSLVVLMGSERQGLQPQHLALCDEVVRIPMKGKSDSLNLAVATAVVLYEILNQRRDKR